MEERIMEYRISGLIKIWLSIIVMCLTLIVTTEGKTPRSNNYLSNEAESYFFEENYSSALKAYLNLYEYDNASHDLNYKIGVCYINSNSAKTNAIPFLEYASESEDINPEVLYYLGKAYHLNYQFEEAIESFQKFIQIISIHKANQEYVAVAKRQVGMCERAIEYINNSNDILIENLGSNINSPNADYAPLISADEDILIFTSRRTGGIGKDVYLDGYPYDDIYMSFHSEDFWSKAINIGANINSDRHDATVGLSADGQQLLVYKQGDIYSCNLEGDQWSYPSKLPIVINTKNWEPSASLSLDKDFIYFTSDRRGGYGGTDIWRIRQLPTGEWSLAQNLGPDINTKYDEDGPFIHSNTQTLYFSSKGHTSMGGYDIFKTSILNNGSWSVPENLGAPINTPDDDIYIVISGDGQYAYYSSLRKDGYGEKDIYRITFPKVPALEIAVKCIFLDENNNPGRNKITITDSKTNDLIGYYNPNRNGEFVAILSPEKTYTLSVKDNDGNIILKNLEIPYYSEFVVLTETFSIEQTNDEEELKKEQEIELRNEILALVEIKEQKELNEQKNDQWEQALISLAEMKDQLKNSDPELLSYVEDGMVEEIFEDEQMALFNPSNQLQQESQDYQEILSLDNEINNENNNKILNQERSMVHFDSRDAYFKIQVGAYTNKIPFDKLPHFDDISREFSETIKLNTYTTGLFHDFEEAKGYLQVVKDKGINDAFIVAFIDGNRIPLWTVNRPSNSLLIRDALATK